MITKTTWQEWKQSIVHDEIIKLNVKCLTGDEALEHLLYSIPNTERRNDGRLRDKWLSRYQHIIDNGGWWVSGLDPSNKWRQMNWGRLKPNTPTLDRDRAKPIKYESPPKTPNRVTYFNIPPTTQLHINQRYGKPDNQISITPTLFWEWVRLNPHIPIILTEGEKKAACLLSLGFVAIALPGIWNGRVGQKDLNERLHPDLLPMAHPEREFIILFDYETKPSTCYSLFQASIRTARAVEKEGARCSIALLPGPEKGVDDLVAAREQEAASLIQSILDDALTPSEYRGHFYRTRSGLGKYHPQVKVNAPYLSDVVELPQSGLVVIKSDMGTGKTELMKRWREEHSEMRFLNNGHRVNLLKNLSSRLNTEIYSSVPFGDLTRTPALSITVDSLHKLINGAHTYDCIFIDETCQYLSHLLHSKTCKEFRAEILEVLEYLIKKASLVVLADAHMDEATIDFFAAMRPDDTPLVIDNKYKNGGRDLYWYEGGDSSGLVSEIFAALLSNQKIMVVSDSKRFIKKLEAAIAVDVDDREPDKEGKLKVWSVHSDNSGSQENIAFIKNISKEVKGLDALLASPSLGTGVDIPDYHFDLIFGAFHGVSQTATECAQALHRYRPHVPMHVWVSPRPPLGYLETNSNKIKTRLLESNQMTAFLIRIDKETGTRGAEKEFALDAYCRIESTRNRSLNNLRDDLRFLLSNMGHKVIKVGGKKDAITKEKLKAAAHQLDAAHFAKVANANDITKKIYRARQTKDYLSPEEVYECEKFRILESYGMPVTEGLVQRDDGGSLIAKLAALEAVLSLSTETIKGEDGEHSYPAPPTIVQERDLFDRELHPLSFDWSNYSSKWLAQQRLLLPSILSHLLSGEEVTAKDPELIRMHDIALSCRVHIKSILGFTIPVGASPIWILATLLDRLGLKLIARRKGPRGSQVRHYSLEVEHLNFATRVLLYRDERRQEKERSRRDDKYSSVATPPKKDSEIKKDGGLSTNHAPSDSLILNYLNLINQLVVSRTLFLRDVLQQKHWTRLLRSHPPCFEYSIFSYFI
jgi:hypothetical protein